MSYPLHPILPAPGHFNAQRLAPTLLWRSSHELSQNCQVSIDLSVLTLLAGVSIVAKAATT
ncbi:hypothetical protein R5M92_11400 [Halomonas sp. Bachu 37]|uniref:hypothetical protein n=1 Tax=Halomonas kashgarensis TaxID=3084920 RepID=UPI003216E7EC